MTARYGNAEKFLNTFKPDMQVMAARYTERAYFGTAPMLETVCLGYGELVVMVFICALLEDINLFVGVKEKMPVNRQRELSRLVLAEYPYLKVTELLLFFHRLKCGRYGRFYGMVDALTVTSALMQFMGERLTETNRYKAARKKEETGECVVRRYHLRGIFATERKTTKTKQSWIRARYGGIRNWPGCISRVFY